MISIFTWYWFLFRCSTTVESFPSAPAYSSGNGEPPELQKIRVLVGAPLRRPPKHQIIADSLMPMFHSIDSDTVNLNREQNMASSHQEKYIRPEGLGDFFIFCTSDFTTASKEVHVRTRRVRLLGLEVFSLPTHKFCIIFCFPHCWMFYLWVTRALVRPLFSRQYWVKANWPLLPILKIYK